jgi:16S rRNA processing protein RimM
MSDAPVAVARAVKTRGLKGEIVADALTDFPARFDDLRELIALAPDGGQLALRLERHWFQGARVVLKFAGYDTPEAAQTLVGHLFAVPESECVALAANEFYDWQLEGCRVETLAGQPLGRVREVLRYGANETLAVASETAGRDYLLPFVAAICVEVDVEKKLIRVDPPDGILDF